MSARDKLDFREKLRARCQDVLADGVVEQSEAESLLAWLDRESADLPWPGDEVYSRLQSALADGHLDAEEELELLKLLASIAAIGQQDGEWESTGDLPLDRPVPEIDVAGSTFCLTGVFKSGSRGEVAKLVAEAGGKVEPRVTLKTRYLVIGQYCQPAWKHGAYGSKILTAVDYRSRHGSVAIISEEALEKALRGLSRRQEVDPPRVGNDGNLQGFQFTVHRAFLAALDILLVPRGAKRVMTWTQSKLPNYSFRSPDTLTLESVNRSVQVRSAHEGHNSWLRFRVYEGVQQTNDYRCQQHEFVHLLQHGKLPDGQCDLLSMSWGDLLEGAEPDVEIEADAGE
ncbi:MAG: BRCT domain-containing protein [Pseudogulbenkiania sp.]|nr:BRCT domain-containing protein [Pseudogulbenkiania sp.]